MAKILVIAPHPDDEVLGCGGTIARHIDQNDEVALCLVTEAYAPDWSEEYIKQKADEVRRVSDFLGISKIYSLKFPTVKLDSIPNKQLCDKLSEVARDFKPDIFYIPHQGDINLDHQLVHQAALIAVRPINGRTAKILSYGTLSETEWALVSIPFVPNTYVDIEKYLEKKIQAMRLYASEIKPFPHPRSAAAIEALARKRGSEANLEAAEAFYLIREIIS